MIQVVSIFPSDWEGVWGRAVFASRTLAPCKLAYLSFHNQHKYCPVVNCTTVDYSAFWCNCICGGQSLHAYTSQWLPQYFSEIFQVLKNPCFCFVYFWLTDGFATYFMLKNFLLCINMRGHLHPTCGCSSLLQI